MYPGGDVPYNIKPEETLYRILFNSKFQPQKASNRRYEKKKRIANNNNEEIWKKGKRKRKIDASKDCKWKSIIGRDHKIQSCYTNFCAWVWD